MSYNIIMLDCIRGRMPAHGGWEYAIYHNYVRLHTWELEQSHTLIVRVYLHTPIRRFRD